MATIVEMLKRVESFDPVQATGEAMQANEEKILDVNRDQLYEQGVGKDGQPLPPYKSAQYAKKKLQQRGKSIVDIFRSGKLQREMELTVQGDEYSIFSKVPYSQYVVGARPTIYGLDPDGKREAWNIVSGDVADKLAEQMQVK